MISSVSIDTLISLDDAAAREAATRLLVEQILAGKAAEPLPADYAWIRQIHASLIDGLLSDSALGWIEDRDDSDPLPSSLAELFDPMSQPHAEAARLFYHQALLHHCHDGHHVLVDFTGTEGRDRGRALAAHATSQQFVDTMAASQNIAAIDLLLGKLAWLAPDEVPDVAGRLAEVIPPLADIVHGYKGGPFPVFFRWEENDLRSRTEPALGLNILAQVQAGTSRIGNRMLASSSEAAGLIEWPDVVERLTESAFRTNLERLSPCERRLLLDALVASLPFLGKAIGTFLDEPLRRMQAAARL